MATEEILELSGLTPERPHARIRHDGDPEGTVYELSVPEDFGAVPLARLGQLINRMDELWVMPSLTKSQEKQLEGILDKIGAALIRDAPIEAVQSLPAVQKRGLALRFLVSTGQMTSDTMGNPGFLQESLSPGSSASTGETP